MYRFLVAWLAINRLVLAIFIVLATGIGIVAWVTSGQYHPMARELPPAPGNYSGSNSGNILGAEFGSSAFAQYAYLISGNATLSASGKVATYDFNLTAVQLQNGSVEYTMRFHGTGATYSVTVGEGDRLYYIDENLADDTPNADAALFDDGYAAVDSAGQIIAYRYPLQNA